MGHLILGFEEQAIQGSGTGRMPSGWRGRFMLNNGRGARMWEVLDARLKLFVLFV